MRPELIEIEFTSEAADYIREREWHRSQELVDRADGSLLLRLCVCNDRRLRSWILSFGPLAHVVARFRLAQDVFEALRFSTPTVRGSAYLRDGTGGDARHRAGSAAGENTPVARVLESNPQRLALCGIAKAARFVEALTPFLRKRRRHDIRTSAFSNDRGQIPDSRVSCESRSDPDRCRRTMLGWRRDDD